MDIPKLLITSIAFSIIIVSCYKKNGNISEYSDAVQPSTKALTQAEIRSKAEILGIPIQNLIHNDLHSVWTEEDLTSAAHTQGQLYLMLGVRSRQIPNCDGGRGICDIFLKEPDPILDTTRVQMPNKAQITSSQLSTIPTNAIMLNPSNLEDKMVLQSPKDYGDLYIGEDIIYGNKELQPGQYSYNSKKGEYVIPIKTISEN